MPEHYDTISKAHLAAGRAIDQLRRQLGIVLHEDNKVFWGACPIEGLTPTLLRQLQSLPQKKLSLLLATGQGKNLCIEADTLSLEMLLTLSDPLAKKVPLPDIAPIPTTPAQDRVLAMAKYASLLPAMLAVTSQSLQEDWLQVSLADIVAYWSDPPLEVVALAHAALPIAGAEDAQLTCFRTRFGTSTHLALTFGDITKVQAPLTRIHSSCITGDILGSLRCDCGDQLHMALDQLREAGNGILLYLHQEGRGIGIANKIRAYQLQERGLDTYDANLALGYGEDERDFSIAAAILKTLGVQQIRLLTNNPQKIAAVEKAGIRVIERVELIAKAGEHNQAYLDAKAKKSGHLF